MCTHRTDEKNNQNLNVKRNWQRIFGRPWRIHEDDIKTEFKEITQGCVCGSDSPTSESIFSSATYFFSVVQQPPVGQNLLIIEASSLHSDTSHSVGLLWTSDQSDAETYTGQYSTFAMDRHPCSRWDSKPKSQRPQTPTLDRAATGTGYLKI